MPMAPTYATQEHVVPDTKTVRIAFLGPKGTYSHQVAYDRFRESAIYVEKTTIADTFNALPSEASFSLLPKENTIFGSVIETYDLLRSLEVGKEKFIREEITLQVQHSLLVTKGTRLQDIKRVFSHEQALGQCTKFLGENLPEAALVKMPSTAAAAQAILADDMRSDSGAICSEVCTSVYDGLTLLFKGVQNENINYTKFWLLSDSPVRPLSGPLTPSESEHTLLRVSPPPPPPSKLPDLTALIVKLGLYVTNIDRRPSTQAIPFHDVYFLEVSRNCTINGEDKERPWAGVVDDAVERVKNLGWDACVLGYW